MRTAVATFGFGRPDHFAHDQSLGTCPKSPAAKWMFHYIDGGPGAEQEALRAVIEGSGVPYLEIVARPDNLGVDGNSSVRGGNCSTSEVRPNGAR